MFCPNCGTRCADTAAACPACGELLPSLMDASLSRKTKSPPGGVPDGETMVAPDAEPPERSAAPPRRSPGPRSPQLGDTKLVVEQGRILGEQFLLSERDTVIGRYDGASGRCPDIDLTAQDPAYVHRQHVRLVFNRAGDQLLIHDLGGRNGAYLNNQLIEPNASAVVQLGDKIRIGRVVLRVQNVRDLEDDRDA